MLRLENVLYNALARPPLAMTGTMSRSAFDTTTLDNHAALACRLIKTQSHLKPYYDWLARPVVNFSPPLTPNLKVVESIALLLGPLRSEGSELEQRETQFADRWLASICQMVVCNKSFEQNGWQAHLLAAALLPLYRTLAAGRLSEGFLQSRRRLSESLVLLGLIEHLCLDELLSVTVNAQVSPHRVLLEQVQIDLTRLDFLVTTCVSSYDEEMKQLRSDALQALKDFNYDHKLSSEYQTPGWAEPQTLWVLSNELLSSRSDFVLPRSWLDTPVPWGRIIEHWHSIDLILNQNPQAATATTESLRTLVLPHASPSAFDQTPVTTPPSPEVQTQLANPIAELRNSLETGLQRIEAIDHAIRNELHDQTANNSDQCNERKIVPKLVIGEIRDLEDPAFLNVLKRHVAVCRMEARAICLSMLIILPDGETNIKPKSPEREFGLNRWQQKVVDWLADHPSLGDPIAFVTGDGQLIVTVLDVERSEMTTILRQCLLEVLSGGTVSSTSLCHVSMPARFHAGIASTSAPSASLDPQELIHSAHRCLTVAQRLGKASIKSIEVY